MLNLSCVSAVSVRPDGGKGYCAASYAALNVLTVHLAAELTPYAVRANAVCFEKATGWSKRRVAETVLEALCGSETGLIREVPLEFGQAR